MNKTKNNSLSNRIHIKNMYNSNQIINMFGQISATLGIMVDGVIIGRFLGGDVMAAYGLAMPIMPVFMMLVMLIISGVQMLCGRYLGKGDRQGANSIFALSITLGLVISIVFTALVLIFMTPLLHLLGASNDAGYLFADARSYITGLCFGFVFMMLNMVLGSFMQFEGDRARTMMSLFASLVVNVILDFVVVFGFGSGLFGVALATVISNAVGFFISLSHFVGGKTIFRYSPGNINWGDIGELLLGGFTMTLNRLCYFLRIVLLNRFVLLFSDVSMLTAVSIKNNMYNLLGTPALSAGITILMCTGIIMSERNKDSVRSLLKTSIKNGLIQNLILGVGVFVFARGLSDIYAHGNTTVINHSIDGLRYFALAMIPFAICQVIIGYLQGVGWYRQTVIFTLVHDLLLPVGGAYILGHAVGIQGFWASHPIGEVLMLIILLLYFAVKSKRAGQKFKEGIFPQGFDVPENRQREWSVFDAEGVLAASEDAFRWLKETDESSQKTMLVSLCIEELANNIISYGAKGKEKLLVYIRVMVEDSGVTLRIRDNGKQFDPTRWLEMYTNEDKTRSIGLRMVSNMAKDFRYINTMGMNTLIIRV